MIDALVLPLLLQQSPPAPQAARPDAPVVEADGVEAVRPPPPLQADVPPEGRPTLEQMAAGIEIPDVEDPLPIGADPLWGTLTATTGGLVGALAGTIAMTTIAAVTVAPAVPDGQPEPPPTPEQTARNQFVTIGTLAAPIGLGVIGAAVSGLVVSDPALALTGAFGATAGAALGATGGFIAAAAATSGATPQDADWIRASTFGGIVTLGTAAGAAIGGAIGAWVRMPADDGDPYATDEPGAPADASSDDAASEAASDAASTGDDATGDAAIAEPVGAELPMAPGESAP